MYWHIYPYSGLCQLFFSGLSKNPHVDTLWKSFSGNKKTMKFPDDIGQYLFDELDKRKGQHSQIAEKSGVPQTNVSRIYCTKGKANIRLKTAQRLINYFQNNPVESGQ